MEEDKTEEKVRKRKKKKVNNTQMKMEKYESRHRKTQKSNNLFKNGIS